MANLRRNTWKHDAMLTGVVFVFMSVLLSAPALSLAASRGSAPVVSISIGTNQDLVPVYATITDNHLQTYHFRVVKDGAAQGHTCNDLFASENQGYASSTLGRDACGFAFNQSVYTFASPTGFTNKLIAALDTQQLAAYGGYGDYWLVLGARDWAGNRTAANYLEDPKVKITIAAPASTSTATTTTSQSDVVSQTPPISGGVGRLLNPDSVQNTQATSSVVDATTSITNNTDIAAHATFDNIPKMKEEVATQEKKQEKKDSPATTSVEVSDIATTSDQATTTLPVASEKTNRSIWALSLLILLAIIFSTYAVLRRRQQN